MDIIDTIRNEIEMMRGRVPLLTTEETIEMVVRIRHLENMVGDVVAARHQAALLAGRTVPAAAVVIAGPVTRPAWQAPVRTAVAPQAAMPRPRGLSVVRPGDEVTGWSAQRARCYAALVTVYAALVRSREDSLD